MTPSTFSTYSRFLLALLLLPFLAACDTSDELQEVETPTQNIVEIAVGNDFDTLVAAVQAADLVATLEGPGPFTVFAPTDAAFSALPEGTVDTLLQPENKDMLVDVLTYHVVSGRVTADEVVNLTTATTVQGDQLNIRVVNGVVFINDAEVITTDIEATNGIIHVIDSVLLPPSN